MIIRGTTPTHTFTIPFNLDSISEIYITYTQKGATVFEKTRDELTFNDSTREVSFVLTQVETLMFSANNKKIADDLVYIQIRILTNNNESYASDIVKERVSDILKDGEI